MDEQAEAERVPATVEAKRAHDELVARAEHAQAHPETWVNVTNMTDAEFLAFLKAGKRV
jgi:hypothetical protein